jgi:hypothetical protein
LASLALRPLVLFGGVSPRNLQRPVHLAFRLSAWYPGGTVLCLCSQTSSRSSFRYKACSAHADAPESTIGSLDHPVIKSRCPWQELYPRLSEPRELGGTGSVGTGEPYDPTARVRIVCVGRPNSDSRATCGGSGGESRPQYMAGRPCPIETSSAKTA